jgi:hypothetical protein
VPSLDQLEFLDLVIDHLTARGVRDPKLLYEAPFTDFDRNGVEGVFEQLMWFNLTNTAGTEPRFAVQINCLILLRQSRV